MKAKCVECKKDIRDIPPYGGKYDEAIFWTLCPACQANQYGEVGSMEKC